MRKMILAAIMAASALVPAAAFAQDDRPRPEQRGRSDSRNQPRAAQPAPQRTQQQAPQQATPPQQPRFERPAGGDRPARGGGDFRGGRSMDSPNFRRPEAQQPVVVQPPRAEQQQRDQSRFGGQNNGRFDQRDRGTPDRERGGFRPDRNRIPGADPARDPQRTELRGDRSELRTDSRFDRQRGDRGGDWRNRDDRRGDGSRDGRPNVWRGGNDRNDDGARNGRNNGGWNDDRDRGSRGNDRSNNGGWSRNWRQDRRYDYSSWRNQNRNAYHLPRYYAPYGWNYGYRRFEIGFSLSSVLFGQDYWIDDADYYRLPPAYGPYRWVRYYNDALLVDIRTGYVVDTVYDIFW